MTSQLQFKETRLLSLISRNTTDDLVFQVTQERETEDMFRSNSQTSCLLSMRKVFFDIKQSDKQFLNL